MEEIINNYWVKRLNFVNGDNTTNILNMFPIYVINLKKDIYRRCYMIHLLNQLGINYSLIIVNEFNIKDKQNINVKNNRISLGQIGCVLSHLWCINDAIKSNYEKFIIFEDDIIFHKNFNELIQKYVHFNLDLLMLGACDFNLNQNLISNPNVVDLYYPTELALGAHANLYSLNFAKVFYNYKLTNLINEFDVDYTEFYRDYKIAICYPNLIICELSTSNIQHNYGPLNVHPHKHYINRCFPVNFTYNDYNYIIIDIIKFIVETKVLIHNNTYIDIIKIYTEQLTLKEEQKSEMFSRLTNNLYDYTDLISIKNMIRKYRFN
jgi:GR25 family glycosyltransferase involved in LPS biosynthesis